MKNIIFLMLFCVIANASEKKVTTKKPFFMEVSERWDIRSTDDQVFSLRTENTSLGPMQSVSFLNGERELKNSPVFKSIWINWRTKLVQMSERFPASKNCPHPIKFENIKKGAEAKSKSVCLDKLTETERESIHSLTQELNEFLYGK